MPIAMVATDHEGVIVAANEYALALFGYQLEELVGLPIGRLSAENKRRTIDDWLARPDEPLLSRPNEAELRFRGCRKDQGSFPIEIGHQTVPGGHLFALVDLSARRAVEARLLKLSIELGERTGDLENRTAQLQAEIEQRRRAEAELERSREDFRYLFQRNPLPMYLFNPHTLRFLEVNDAASALYGYSQEEFRNLLVTDIHPPDKAERMREMIRENSLEEFVRLRNWKHCTRSGRVIEVDTYTRLLGRGSQAVRLVVVVDVTERNQAEAQLRQSQKMEAIGQLTGGVAHDFNNLLTIILGNLEMISEECRERPSIRAMVSDALTAVGNGSGLTKRLLAYARQQPLEPRVIDVGALVTDMAGLFRRSLGEAVTVQHFVAPDLWKIKADPTQLESALLNLAVNARDAMPEGGRLTIEAENATLGAEYASERTDVTPGDYVQIAVSDSGAGIPPEILEHILEPFFTTKPVGKGTGLGLSMVYGFTRQSGGHLNISSEPGKGTTVQLYLPRTAGEPEQTLGAFLRDAFPRSARGEVIVVVEDDATIRKLVQKLLGLLGYEAIGAGSGTEALEVLGRTVHVDLLLTDVVLPGGMSGAQLAEEAQRRYPKLRVLYMSGYTRNTLIGNSVHDENAHVLSKPFRKEELARAVHRVLNS